MKHLSTLKISSIIVSASLLAACNQPAKEAEPKALNLEDSDTKVAYAIGASAGKAMARNLATLDGTDITIDTDVLVQAFGDGVKENSALDEESIKTAMNDFRGRVNEAMQAKRAMEKEEQTKVAAENIAKGTAYLAENKSKEGVVTLESGLQYKVLTEGTGKKPTEENRVKVHYKGTLIDGTQFDSSYDRDMPATFGVTQVIKGWTEALMLMPEGSKWQLTIPSELAYGETPRPKIPGNSVLLFDVELIEVMPARAAGAHGNPHGGDPHGGNPHAMKKKAEKPKE